VDRIRLNDMVFYGYHGALPEERKRALIDRGYQLTDEALKHQLS